MKLNSISGITAYAKDLQMTADFYKKLGFRVGNQDGKTLTVYVNWFWIRFCVQNSEINEEFKSDAHSADKGAGLFINIKVDNVDEVYSEVIALELQPSSEPRDWEWGNREFVLRDPDGYKLVFFQKK